MKTVLQSLWKSRTLGILVCESISKNISVFSIRHLLFLKISRQQYEKVTGWTNIRNLHPCVRECQNMRKIGHEQLVSRQDKDGRSNDIASTSLRTQVHFVT